MEKGVILELKEQEAIVLTADGQFRAVPLKEKAQWRVGEEIALPVPEQRSSFKQRKWRIPAIAIAASFLLVFASVLVYSTLWVDNTAVAYVYMDINPSVEMSINKSLEVLTVSGQNRAGEELVSYLEDWSHESLKAVSLQLFQLAKDQGYIDGQHQVLVAASPLEAYQNTDYHQSIYAAMQEVELDLRQSENFMAGMVEGTNENIPEDIFYMHQIAVEPDVFKEAKEQGISPGKYLLYLKAKENGLNLDLDQVARSNVTHLDQQVGGIRTLVAD